MAGWLAGFSAQAQTITETFGTGTNAFSIDFVTIGSPGNAADTTGVPNPVGAVSYTYNLGKFEVSREMILKANAAAGLGITMYDMTSYGGNGLNKPATGVSWNEAARFVNYLNTSQGYQAAYQFTTSGANAHLTLLDAGKYNGNNRFRHKDAYYFLPTVDEWYKGAYGSPTGVWYDYATGSNTVPTAVASGTDPGTVVYKRSYFEGPADVDAAGGLSAYGTMGQGGNAWEWAETAYDGLNDSPLDNRELRGQSWGNLQGGPSSTRLDFDNDPMIETYNLGFRVASAPEPSSASLMILGAGALLALKRRRSAV